MGMHAMLGLTKLQTWELFVCTWHKTLLRLYTEADLARNIGPTVACYSVYLLQTAPLQVEPDRLYRLYSVHMCHKQK